MALRQGQCVGWVHDGAQLRRMVDDPAWDGFAMPLAPVNRIPWAVAVARDAADGPLGRFVTARLVAWQRTGMIADLGRRHGLAPAPFVREQHARWTARHADGGYVCTRAADGGIPDVLLMLMGSSTASVIGVNEIVGRANTIVTALGAPGLTAWIHAYVALWFIAAGAGMSALLRRGRG